MRRPVCNKEQSGTDRNVLAVSTLMKVVSKTSVVSHDKRTFVPIQYENTPTTLPGTCNYYVPIL
jgi:hypothetical protein